MIDLNAATKADPLLFKAASELYGGGAAAGSATLYALAHEHWRALALRASGRFGGNAAKVGAFLLAYFYELGISGVDLTALVNDAIVALKAPAPKKVTPSIPDPMPGLRLNGQTYPEWAVSNNGRMQMGEVGAQRMAWQAAQAAYDRGEGEAWATGDGKALGASWTAAEATAVAVVVLPEGVAPGEG